MTIAEENADITIEAFSFRIWLEDNRVYIEKLRITKEKVFHSEQELLEEQYGSKIDFEESDSFYFAEGSVTVFANGPVLEMPVEDYETGLPKKAPDKVPFEGFSKYKCSPWLIKKVPTEKIEINIPPVSKKTDSVVLFS